ncbi:tetratricopeptide repeat protein (plasmid) [Streptomyces sp. BI20]|uniref:tetratricopeptide repeat protein n=1 Tax=Streptomyces sp. BI20 TaxID=3403460 RepID=UPI003C735B8E
MPLPNTLLRGWIRESGWTYESLARRVNSRTLELGYVTGFDRTTVAHWVRGTRPRDPVPEVLCELFSQRLGRSLTPADLGLSVTVGARVGVGAGMWGGTAGADVLRVLGSVPGLRAEGPGRPGSWRGGSGPTRWRSGADADAGDDDVVLPAPRASAGPPRADASEAVTSSVTSAFTGAVTDTSGVGRAVGSPVAHPGVRRTAERFFIAQVDALGGAVTGPMLLAYLQGLLSRSRAVADGTGPGPGAAESAHAARAVCMLARSYIDSCASPEARRSLDCAVELAALGRDHAAGAIALRMLSAEALERGRMPAALAYLRRAGDLAGRAPSPVRAYVAAQAGVVHATSGNRADALGALDAAARLLARVDPTSPELADPFHRYGPEALAYQRAIVLRLLGDPEGAGRALDESVRRRPAEQDRAVLFTLVERAHIHRVAGRREEALCALERAGEVNAQVQSPRAAREIDSLLLLLAELAPPAP